MTNLLEVKNILKELIKGTSIEPFARSVFELIKPPKDNIITSRQDDRWAIQIMQRVLTKDSNCIDIGCHTGDLLIPILKFAPSGHHYAFEPIPRLADRLRRRFPKVNVIQTALSDVEEEATFYYDIASPALSSLNLSNCNDSKNLIEPITVRTQRLDDILTADFKVSLIKIDVEGAELQVFRGAIRTLKTCKPYIIFEHGRNNSDSSGNTSDKIYQLLVNECDLQIFALKSWLEGSSPLSREKFINSSVWNFLAAPVSD